MEPRKLKIIHGLIRLTGMRFLISPLKLLLFQFFLQMPIFPTLIKNLPVVRFNPTVKIQVGWMKKVKISLVSPLRIDFFISSYLYLVFNTF